MTGRMYADRKRWRWADPEDVRTSDSSRKKPARLRENAQRLDHPVVSRRLSCRATSTDNQAARVNAQRRAVPRSSTMTSGSRITNSRFLTDRNRDMDFIQSEVESSDITGRIRCHSPR